MGGLQSLWYESSVSQHGADHGTTYLHHLLQNAGIVIIEIDWSHFPLHFAENAMTTMFGRDAIGKVPPPKASIRSIPKLSVLKNIRQGFEEPLFEFRTLQMTETGPFLVCDSVRLLPEESTPMGEYRSSYTRAGRELMKIGLFDLDGPTVVSIDFMMK